MIGCAAEPNPQATAVRPLPPPSVATAAEPDHTSAALAFDPPITLSEATPDLSRDQRGQAALIGFEEPTTNVFDVFTYNRQASDNSDYYDKEAVSQQVGTTHR